MPLDLNMLQIFANLGIAGISLGIIYVMLQYFMRSLSQKDLESKEERRLHKDELKSIVNDFKGHIELCNTNFIKVNTNTTKVLKTVAMNLSSLQDSPINREAALFMADKGKKIDEIYTSVVTSKTKG